MNEITEIKRRKTNYGILQSCLKTESHRRKILKFETLKVEQNCQQNLNSKFWTWWKKKTIVPTYNISKFYL